MPAPGDLSCFGCNFILGTLPPAAKDALIPGLHAARQSGAFADWIPARRRKVT